VAGWSQRPRRAAEPQKTQAEEGYHRHAATQPAGAWGGRTRVAQAEPQAARRGAPLQPPGPNA
jgi:hypothetical protein